MNPLCVFNSAEEHLVVDSETGAWCVTNDSGLEVIRLFDRHHTIAEISEALASKYGADRETIGDDLACFLRGLRDAGFWCDSRPVIRRCDDPSLSSLSIHITSRCDKSCDYCYLGDRKSPDMPMSLLTRVVDEAVDLGCAEVLITGGEPTVRDDLPKIIERIGEKTPIRLMTNGYRVNRAMAKLLATHGVAVQVSLDDLNDADAMAGLNELLLAGMSERIVLSITVTRSNIGDVADIVLFALANGVRQINMRPVVPQGSAKRMWRDLTPTETQYAEMARSLLPLLVWKSDRVRVRGCFVDSILGSMANPDGQVCNAGEKLVIGGDGSVYPCSMLMHDEWKAGDLHESSLAEIWRGDTIRSIRERVSRRVETIGECANCVWRRFCRGGCPGSALWSKGRADGTDQYCDLRKHLYPDLLLLYARIARKNER